MSLRLTAKTIRRQEAIHAYYSASCGILCALPLFFVPCAWCQHLYATGEATEQLVEVDMSTGVVTLLSKLTAKPDSLIVDSKGRILYTTTVPGTVSMFDPSTGLTSVVASGFSYPRDLIFDPSGTSLLVANFGIGAIDREIDPPEAVDTAADEAVHGRWLGI